MSLIAQGDVDFEGAERAASNSHEADATLWSAIQADRRAWDERTARLRAMRLILGDDEPVESA